jgi:hypothetical protein
MNIRAKFRCISVNNQSSYEAVTFQAVSGKDGTANAQWSKWTPSGEARLTITNPEARGVFKPDTEYFLDFSEAPPEG